MQAMNDASGTTPVRCMTPVLLQPTWPPLLSTTALAPHQKFQVNVVPFHHFSLII
jgi:hypothetical protein